MTESSRQDEQPDELNGKVQRPPVKGTGGATAGDQAVPSDRPHHSGGTAAGDVATPLQPGGTLPGGGPGAGLGSIGTGGGNTAGGATGSQKHSGR
jgi:hypothetical protein